MTKFFIDQELVVSRLFAFTVFASAALMFTVEPLIGKSLLPLAGGTPAVWTTCLLFFQVALLAGYAYAHGVGDRLAPRHQVLLHLPVVVLPLIALPLTIDPNWFAGTGHPVLSLLPMLAKLIGLPFFALATTAPLMQRWFALTEPKGNPYPLYAASNAGSLIALAAYPFLLEPTLGLLQQRWWWSVGYGLYVWLVAFCGVRVWQSATLEASKPVIAKSNDDPWLKWLLLSFAPSSLLMSVTTAVTTDITPVPLLWVLPLALYLLTFILAFAGRPVLSHNLVLRIAPIAALAVLYAIFVSATKPWWAVLGIHLLAFFVVSLACHGELARLKPPPERLTRFYLIMSVGGVLGGLLNAVVAPVAFQKLGMAEYPLVLIVAMALMPRRPKRKELKDIPEATGARSLAFPFVVGALTVAAVIVARYLGRTEAVVGGLLFGVPLVFMFLLVDRPLRFAAGLLLMWFASLFYVGESGSTLYFERNFFGKIKVGAESDGAHILIHGSTIHGRQLWDKGKALNVPLTYYGKIGPLGDIFSAIEAKGSPPVAACGLGAGSMAPFAKPGQAWTYYEIDPAMVRVAQDPSLFAFLTDNFPNGKGLTVEIGDARLEMARAPKGGYGLIVLDAFSSDSIPVHLLTREAIVLYLDKLAPNGLIAFHISNRYLNLEPVLASAAKDLNLIARVRREDVEGDEAKLGRLSSIWVVLARNDAALGKLAALPEWRPLPAPPKGFRIWTDDYSNLLSVFNYENE